LVAIIIALILSYVGYVNLYPINRFLAVLFVVFVLLVMLRAVIGGRGRTPTSTDSGQPREKE